MTPERRAANRAKWSEIGEDAIRADLEHDNGIRYVGNAELREEAWRWLNELKTEREAKKAEIDASQRRWQRVGVAASVANASFSVLKAIPIGGALILLGIVIGRCTS